MAAEALYRKWRSQDFAEVVGQEHVTLTLRNALREGRMSHAYLFTGPRGTGKTSTARILAKAINCLDPDPAARPCNTCSICTAITEGRQLDLIEIDAASNRGIDEIRDLREKIGFRPNEARYKVYIIDEVHMLTKEAFNALLKTLEEPPPHAIFVLATTEPDRVPETVRSRCQRFDFRRIPTAEIVGHLEEILGSESGKAEPEALVAIARRSTGSMRDAVSLLDQLLSYGDDTLTLARVERVLGLVNSQTIGKLVDCIATNDTAGGLTLLNSLVAEGVELGQLVDQIVAYLARRAVHAHGPHAGAARSAAGRDPDRRPPGRGIHTRRVIGRGTRVHRGARRAARSGARRPAVAHRAGLLARRGCDERARGGGRIGISRRRPRRSAGHQPQRRQSSDAINAGSPVTSPAPPSEPTATPANRNSTGDRAAG